MPDVRFSWGINDHATVWAAASRAIRSPTPFDTEVIEKLATTTFLAANPQFRPEEVRAYELGWRSQMSTTASVTIAAFYNVYNDSADRGSRVSDHLPTHLLGKFHARKHLWN